MGTSGVMDTSNQYVKYNISVNQNWQSISENKSNVTVNVYFWRTNSGYTTYGSGTCYCKINGVTYSASVSSSQKITNSGITLFSKTLDIYHNGDGSKQLDCSAWISLNTPLSSSEQWYSQWLSTIPRTSNVTLSSSSVTMGNSVTIYTNRATNYFKHKIYYQIGSNSKQQIADNINVDYTWTVPTSFADKSPNSDKLDVRIWLETYDNGNYLGSSSAVLSAKVPSSYVPQITDVTLREAVDGIHDLFGEYIQTKSKISGSITATGSHSSTIKSYITNINNQTFSGKNFTTNEISGSGTLNAVVTVTDSRGRSASRTVQYTVSQYNVPTITVFKGVRTNSSGVEDDKGNCVLLDISAAITPLNDINTKSFTIKYKKSTEDRYTTIDITPEDSYSYTGTYLIQNIDTDYEYDIMLQVDDYFSNSVKNINIPTGFTLIDFNATGRGMAIGRVSTSDSLQISMDINAEENINLAKDLIQPDYFNGRRMKYIPNHTTDTNITGWYKVLTGKLDETYDDHCIALSVIRPYNTYSGFGRLYINIRRAGNSLSIANFYAEFLGNFQANHFKLEINNDTKEYYLYAYLPYHWGILLFEVISECALVNNYYHSVFNFENPNSEDTLPGEPNGVIPNTVKEKVLYNNASGTNGTITLADDYTNYDLIKIFFADNNVHNVFSFYTDVAYRTPLSTIYSYSGINGVYFHGCLLTFSGKSATFSRQSVGNFTSSGTSVSSDSSLRVYKILGC